MTFNELVPFRLIQMECCGFQACWINPRLPSFCPECGIRVYPYVRGWVTERAEAMLSVREDEDAPQ